MRASRAFPEEKGNWLLHNGVTFAFLLSTASYGERGKLTEHRGESGTLLYKSCFPLHHGKLSFVSLSRNFYLIISFVAFVALSSSLIALPKWIPFITSRVSNSTH